MARFALLATIVIILSPAACGDEGGGNGEGADEGLNAEHFERLMGGGIDDRVNSYPWAMELFDGDGDGSAEVYVGTLANALCLQLPLMTLVPGADPDFRPPERWQCANHLWNPDNWIPYYLATLAPSFVYRGTYEPTAETWTWDQVWAPPLTEVTGFRGARVFNGALYMLGNGTQAFVYESTDGVTWAKASPEGMPARAIAGLGGGLRGAQVFDGRLYVASDAVGEIYASADPSANAASWETVCSRGFVESGGGTLPQVYFSGTTTAATDTTLTDDAKSFRAGVLAGIRVRITAGTGEGQDMPILDNDATTVTIDGTWSPVPDDTSAYEIHDPEAPDTGPAWQLAVFDGHLYAATVNTVTGPEVWKSADPRPGNWTRVIEGGYGNTNVLGYMTARPFGDHLYLGTTVYPPLIVDPEEVHGCEILRLDPEDNVELLVGATRPAGAVAPDEVAPLSGMGPGFDYAPNFYSWYMAEHDDWFYVGTCDFGGLLIDIVDEAYPDGLPPEEQALYDEFFGPDTDRHGGFDLWRTRDGVEWVPVVLDGFGDYDSYGVRNMLSTEWGLLIGVSNAVDGLEIWLGNHGGHGE